MRYYLSDIIPRIRQFSRRLDEEAILLNHNWVLFNESYSRRITYVFRRNNELIATENGVGRRLIWENIGNQRMLIEDNGQCVQYNIFFDETFLVLNLNDTSTYAFLINERKLGNTFINLVQINDYLQNKYELPMKIEKPIRGNIIVPCYTNKGKIHIEYEKATYPKIKTGLNVLIDKNPAPDGKYKIGFMKYIQIRYGMIAEITWF